MSYYEKPWESRPPEFGMHGMGTAWRRTSLDKDLPASMDLEGWHLQAWTRPGGDPYFLYAPDGTLVGRWEWMPSLSALYDCWRQFVGSPAPTGGAPCC